MNEYDHDEWLSGVQAALLLGVSASRVRQLRLGHALAGTLTPGGWRYQVAAVAQLAETRHYQPELTG